MGLFRRQRMFAPRPDGRFEVKLPPEAREVIVALTHTLEDIIATDRPETKRLFPTAYVDDPERDAGYQVFARDQLIEQRRDAVALIRQTATKDLLTEEELSTWMGVLNDLRLVLGTVLDVSEDDHNIDLDSPDAETHILYGYLGEIVHNMVEALTTALPEAEDDEVI